MFIAFQSIRDTNQGNRDLKVKKWQGLEVKIGSPKRDTPMYSIYTAMYKYMPKYTAMFMAVFAPGMKIKGRHDHVSRPHLRRAKNTGSGHARVSARVLQCEHLN